MATQLPDTDSKDVMRMAVAWHLVIAINDYPGNTASEMRQNLTQSYIDTYNALVENERQQSPRLSASSHPGL